MIRTNPYWNAGWFYEKNASVPDIHDGLPKFINEPPEELASWSFVPSLAQTPILEKAARRISWLVHDGLTGYSLQLDTLAEENFRSILRVPVSGDAAEEVPDDEEEEEEQAPRKAAPRPSKRPRAKASGSEAGASGEASAKKPKTMKPPPLNSKKAERERLKMLSTAGKRSRPIIPDAPNLTTTATRTTSQEPITKYMKKSPAVGPPTPAPPSTSHTAPQPSPPQADPSPPPAANTPPEIVPVSSEKVGGEDPKAKGPAQEEAEEQGQGEAEVTSSEKAEAGAGDVVVFPKNFGDPADLTSTPKAYATKFFNKLTEAEKWELEQDLLNAMLNNAWGLDPRHRKSRTSRRMSASSSTNSSANKSETIKRQQKELNGLRKYMETAERHWDLLNEHILEPLGYPERNLFPRDDLLTLAGDDCKDLISASRKICHNLSLKKSRTCGLRKLVKKMDILPELVTDLQASSARGAAAMTLTMCLAHNPKLDLDRVTTGVPPDADVGALLDAVSGYDTRIAAYEDPT
ncbi:hypothetical protein QYE76_067125 [Lolium multiflorum]|uniref:Uncharacterized protein n=1 Tax=Lolium multiflorum TaxID=4521 RepID=A0AAD8SE83_LOLMU|nr:hypothetical protein QYE76_067125 [Lolium multiflorum]